MSSGQKPRLEPRLVVAAILLAIPFLWVVGQLLLTQAGDECGAPGESRGGLVQLLVPGAGCAGGGSEELRGR